MSEPNLFKFLLVADLTQSVDARKERDAHLKVDVTTSSRVAISISSIDRKADSDPNLCKRAKP